MRVLLAHSDHAPASLALVNLKGFALADPEIRARTKIRIVRSSVTDAEETFLERLLDAARKDRPDVVGLSLYIWSRHRMYEAARRLRALLPDALVVWGGPDVSDTAYSVELLREHPAVDVVVRHEGELTFRTLLRGRLGLGPGLAETRGIAYRDRATGEIRSNEEAPTLENLDEIPSMLDSDELDFDTVEALAFETFRGCYMGCNYCYWGGTTRRAFSDARVFSDLGRMLALPKLKSIWFFDSMFGYKKSTAKAMLRFIVERKRPDQSVTFFPNLDYLDDELCELFKAAGVYLETGIQTTNDEAYETLNRSWDRPFLDKKLGMLKKHGLVSNVQQLILGLPNDTLEGFRASVNYAFAQRPEAIYVFPFSVLPGTGFWRKREEFALRYEGELRIVYETHRFPERDLLRGGMIALGAKWYEKFPGLARAAVALAGVDAATFFEEFGAAFAAEAWGLELRPENFVALRGKLLTQALPDVEAAHLNVEALRRTLWRAHPGLPHEFVEELIAHEAYLNADVLRLEDAAGGADFVSAWRTSPGATEPIRTQGDLFDPGAPGAATRRVAFVARPQDRPRDFFAKDRPRFDVLVGPPEAFATTPSVRLPATPAPTAAR